MAKKRNFMVFMRMERYPHRTPQNYTDSHTRGKYGMSVTVEKGTVISYLKHNMRDMCKCTSQPNVFIRVSTELGILILYRYYVYVCTHNSWHLGENSALLSSQIFTWNSIHWQLVSRTTTNCGKGDCCRSRFGIW